MRILTMFSLSANLWSVTRSCCFYSSLKSCWCNASFRFFFCFQENRNDVSLCGYFGLVEKDPSSFRTRCSKLKLSSIWIICWIHVKSLEWFINKFYASCKIVFRRPTGGKKQQTVFIFTYKWFFTFKTQTIQPLNITAFGDSVFDTRTSICVDRDLAM